MPQDFFRRVWTIVRLIPYGKVATYGQIAAYLDSPRAARTVGWALHALPDGTDVPWHRVINAKGMVSPHGFGMGTAIQRTLLEDEGVVFNLEGVIDFEKYGWEG